MWYVILNYGYVNRQLKFHSFFCREVTSAYGDHFIPIVMYEFKMYNDRQIGHGVASTIYNKFIIKALF
jgi:hypothetical protein